MAGKSSDTKIPPPKEFVQPEQKAEQPPGLAEVKKAKPWNIWNRTTAMNLQLHLMEERERTAGMTPTERALRKKWVLDQRLHPEEPINIEWKVRNPIRRLYGLPLDFVENRLLAPRIGWYYALKTRKVIGRFLMTFWIVELGWYYMKYCRKTWEFKRTGFTSHKLRTDWPQFPDVYNFEAAEELEPGISQKEVDAYGEHSKDDYYDLGFKERTTHLDLPPSRRPW